MLEHKSGNISETRKDRGKVTNYYGGPTGNHQRTLPSPTPYGLVPKIGGSQPQPKTAIAIISETDFKLGRTGRYTHRIRPNKSPLKIWKKRERGRIQGLPKVFKYLLLSQERVKLGTSYSVRIHRIDRNKSPLKISGKVAVGVLRVCVKDSKKFSGHPYNGTSRGHLCGSSAFLYYYF